MWTIRTYQKHHCCRHLSASCIMFVGWIFLFMLVKSPIQSVLAGGIPTPLKNMKISWDYEFPNLWKNNPHVPNFCCIATAATCFFWTWGTQKQDLGSSIRTPPYIAIERVDKLQWIPLIYSSNVGWPNHKTSKFSSFDDQFANWYQFSSIFR